MQIASEAELDAGKSNNGCRERLRRHSVNIPQTALVLPLLLLCFGDLPQRLFGQRRPPPTLHPPPTPALDTRQIDQEVLELSMQRITAATSCDHRRNENQEERGRRRRRRCS